MIARPVVTMLSLCDDRSRRTRLRQDLITRSAAAIGTVAPLQQWSRATSKTSVMFLLDVSGFFGGCRNPRAE
jgi:hypothetical protein